MKYRAVYSRYRGLKDSDSKSFRLEAQQRLLFPRGCSALLCADWEVNSHANSTRSISRGAAGLMFVSDLSPPVLLALLLVCLLCGLGFFVVSFFLLFSFQNYLLLFKYFQERKYKVR